MNGINLSLFILMFPLQLLAAVPNYQVQTQIYVDGQLASSTRSVVPEGTLTKIDSRSTFSTNLINLNVKAQDRIDSKDAVTLTYDIDYQKGEQKLHLQPTVTNKVGYESTVKVNQDGKEIIIKSVATKI